MASEKEVIKAVEKVLDLLKEKAKVKNEINALIIQREEIAVEVDKGKRKAGDELVKHTEAIKIEMNGLTAQLDSMKGELNRLPSQIKSKQNSVLALDREIVEQKESVKELQKEEKRLKEIVDGMREDAKKYYNKLAGV